MTQPRLFDLVLFDLDGTLIDTAAELTHAINATLAQGGGWPSVPVEVLVTWIGHGTRNLLARAVSHVSGRELQEVLQAPELDALEVEFSRQYLQCCGRHSRLYPQVQNALQALRGHGVKLVVLTNKEARYTHPTLQAHGVWDCFDRVVSGDTLPVRKPDPAAVRQCLQDFGVSASRALLVGDSSIDVTTARNAGIAVWAVPYGYNLGQPLADSAPDRLINDLGALIPAV